jgi:hypothetical protein
MKKRFLMSAVYAAVVSLCALAPMNAQWRRWRADGEGGSAGWRSVLGLEFLAGVNSYMPAMSWSCVDHRSG